MHSLYTDGNLEKHMYCYRCMLLENVLPDGCVPKIIFPGSMGFSRSSVTDTAPSFAVPGAQQHMLIHGWSLCKRSYSSSERSIELCEKLWRVGSWVVVGSIGRSFWDNGENGERERERVFALLSDAVAFPASLSMGGGRAGDKASRWTSSWFIHAPRHRFSVS